MYYVKLAWISSNEHDFGSEITLYETEAEAKQGYADAIREEVELRGIEDEVNIDARYSPTEWEDDWFNGFYVDWGACKFGQTF